MMKRVMVAAAVGMLMVPAMASAQYTINATATVAEYMTITGSGNLAFGTLSADDPNTLDPTTSGVTRTVQFNTDVTVSFDVVPTNLVGAMSGYLLPITLTCAWDKFDESWSTPATCGSENFEMDVGPSASTARLGFGGTITAAAVQAAVADTYSAEMTMIVVGR